MSEMNLLAAEAKEHYSEGTHELHFCPLQIGEQMVKYAIALLVREGSIWAVFENLADSAQPELVTLCRLFGWFGMGDPWEDLAKYLCLQQKVKKAGRG